MEVRSYATDGANFQLTNTAEAFHIYNAQIVSQVNRWNTGNPYPNKNKDMFIYDKVKHDISEKTIISGEKKMNRRIVNIYIVDADTNVPSERALIYKKENIFTDATDQELLFDMNIPELLKEYNRFRVTVRDNSFKQEQIMLEPARIGDLQLRIVEICKF